MTYSPGHTSLSSCTRVLAASKVSAASTKCWLPSPCTLKIQKDRRIQTPNGDLLRGDNGTIITQNPQTERYTKHEIQSDHALIFFVAYLSRQVPHEIHQRGRTNARNCLHG